MILLKQSKARILVVEDDTALLRGLLDVLVFNGYEVKGAEDGGVGLRVGVDEQFDLILLDVMLPTLDGFSICKEIRKEKPTQGIIIITAKGAEDDIITGFKAGTDDYITKPFKLEEFKILIKNASEKIELIKENQSLLTELQEAYKHLNIVKKIMGIHSDSEGEKQINHTDKEGRDLFIAGSMLPQVYLEKKGDTAIPVGSD